MPEPQRRGIVLASAELIADRPALARDLYLARLRKGLRQEELAALVGCRQSDVSEWERGRRIPRPARIELIRRVLA